MSVEIWTAIATGASGIIIGIGGWLIAYPKHRSEGRKFDAEADHLNWTTLSGEIERLNARLVKQDERIAEQDQRIAEQNERVAELEKLDGERESREAELLRENRQLRQKVKRLESRVKELEKEIQVPPGIQAVLDKLQDIE